VLGGWFRGAGASGLGGGVVDRSWRRRLLADIAAALGAQVCGLWALTGDTTSLVVHRGAAVEVFTDLDPSTSVRAALWASGDRDGTPLQRHDVIHADGAPVAETEDVVVVLAGGEAAEADAAGELGEHVLRQIVEDRQRIDQLGTHTSYLNPLWYAGSFAVGAIAGLVGDRWSLGFLAETERQVVEHLSGHLARLPAEDQRSRAVVEKMREDEGRHATVAIEAGASELPAPIKRLMRATARIMTTTAHWI